MDDAETIKSILEGFQRGSRITEDQLLVDLSLEYDEEKDNYVISYGVKVAGDREAGTVVRKFNYSEFETAWNNYLDQLPELSYNFPDANLLLPDPSKFEAAKGGGNPFVKVNLE